TIILRWNAGGTEIEWEVTYDSGSFIAYDTFYVADNLSPNTEYTFTVRAICGAGDTSYPVTYSTRTQCGAITSLPYTESFEGLPAGSSTSPVYEIPCWGRLDNAGQNHFGYVNTRSSWAAGPHTGDNFLYYYIPLNAGTHADWIITILPPVDATLYPINTLQLSFWVRMNSATTSSFIEVGVISNVNDATTFVPVDTVQVAGDVHTLKTAYLTSYLGTGNNIALRFHRNTEVNYFFVDDFTIEEIPDCPAVSNIASPHATSDSITVTWQENGTATQWDIEYGITGFTRGTGTTDTAYTTPTYTFGGLTANTAYDVYVTPYCSGGTASTLMGTFRTTCVESAVPFSENFDSYTTSTTSATGVHVPCWNYIMTGSSTYQGTSYQPQVYYSSSYAHSGSYSLRLYGESYTMLPPMSVPLDSLQLTFWDYCTGAAYLLEVGVMEGNTFVPIEAINTPASTHLPHTVYFGAYTGNSRIIAFRNHNNTPTTYYSYHYIDNVEVNYLPACPPVSGITADSVTENFITVSWAENGSATTWTVEYGIHGFTQGTGATATVTTTPVYTLTGLTANTAYDVYITPTCTSGTPTAIMGTFRTLCGAMTLPYFENFDSYTTSTTAATGVEVPCWDYIMTGSATYQAVTYQPRVYYSSSNAHSGSYSLRLYGESYTMLPPMPTSLDSLQLTFWDYCTGAAYLLEVGVMEGTTFVPVQTINTPASTHQEQTVYFGAYTGNSRIIAFRNYNSSTTSYLSYHYIDDVRVDYIPTCPPVVN
ncbi:MAG: fibronectin type III domain-containing protein, partial [Bacteroidales bacterium]|nr:fibronectin type III domain-containing protein [Bacteroidales bacterium]